MPTIDELKAKALALVTEVQTVASAADDAGRDFTPDERSSIKAKLDEAKSLKEQAAELASDAADSKALRDAVDAVGKGLIDSPAATPLPTGRSGRKTLGQRFTEAPEWSAWLKQASPAGTIPDRVRIDSPPMTFGGLKELERGRFKDVITGGDTTSAGALVTPQDLGLVEDGLFRRPLTVRDLVTTGRTTSDAIEYVRVTGFTNNAAPVPEATGTSAGDASGDVAGTKPESSMVLERVSTTVKTIAHWMPATTRALSDAAQIRTLIDNFLRYGLEEELEDQMIEGDGNGENFSGILDVSGTQSLDATAVGLVDPTATDTLAGIVALRVAKRLIRVNGRANASAYVLNPADNERIDLARDGNGQFYFGGPGGNGVQTAWGLPRVESEAVPEGTAIAADWRFATLWDREQAAISVSNSHADFFVRNLVAILAELRAAFGVLRAPAFVIIDLEGIFGI